MSSLLTIVLIFVAGLLLLNLFACYLVRKSAAYSREQKLYQILLIWFLPVFGTAVELLIIGSDRERKRRPKEVPDGNKSAPNARMLRHDIGNY
jgi:hypothetical protein